MNLTTVEPTSLQPPPQPPQPHRPSTSCDRHPHEHFSGFCPSCLFERLCLLDPNNSGLPKPPSSSSSSASALRAFFRPSTSRKTINNFNNPSSSSFSGLFPELRRTKSFSATKNNGEGLFSGLFEPQRKSCDVRARSSLCPLFGHDDERKATAASKRNSNAEASRHSFVGVKGEVFAEEEEEEIELTGDYKVVKENIEELAEGEKEEDGIVLEECNVGGVAAKDRVAEPEIVEEEEEGRKEGFLLEEEARSMKDHIDLDSQAKKSLGRDFKDFAGSFWSAASVFSKKWQKWRGKQKVKKQERGGHSAMLPIVKPAGHHFRETRSEAADYGFGRRSCDTDPRFSLDAARFSIDVARMSLDDTRRSFEIPRASWDGQSIGRSSFQRMPTIAAAVEDSPLPTPVPRTDMQIPVEMPVTTNSINEDEATPGGSAQTRDYYLDSSSRRRKSFDRSSSIRKTAAAVIAEMDELKSIKNAKVSPATADHYLHGTRKLATGDKDSLRDPVPNLSHSNSLQDDGSEMFNLAFHENGSMVRNGDQRGSEVKKSRRWAKGWSIWAFIHRRAGGGHYKEIDNDGSYGGSNMLVDRSYSESWQDLGGGELNNGFNMRVLRSNSSVSYRNSSMGGPLGGTRRNSFEVNGKKRRDEFVLERNRSAGHSLKGVADSGGMLRAYMTPNGSRRGGGGSVKGRANQAHSIARGMLRLY